MGTHHGMRKSPTYASWASMHDRCKRRPLYVEQGVRICERWGDFRNFFADMGERPAGSTLDRIDPYGHYVPGNCRWATYEQQARNTRLRKANKTGIHGVWWYAERSTFKACIHHRGKVVHLGHTPDFFEACCLRKAAELKFHNQGV